MRKVTPKERLLEYKIEEGWEPLCRFLGKEIPKEPFPHTNEKDYLNEKITIMMRKRGAKVIGGALMYAIPVVLSMAVVWWSYT